MLLEQLNDAFATRPKPISEEIPRRAGLFRALVADSRFGLRLCARADCWRRARDLRARQFDFAASRLALSRPGPGGNDCRRHSEIHFHRTRFDARRSDPGFSVLRPACRFGEPRAALAGAAKLFRTDPTQPGQRGGFLPALSRRQRLSSGELKETPGRHHGRGDHGHSFRVGTAARTAVGSTGGFTGQHRHRRFAVRFSGLVRGNRPGTVAVFVQRDPHSGIRFDLVPPPAGQRERASLPAAGRRCVHRCAGRGGFGFGKFRGRIARRVETGRRCSGHVAFARRAVGGGFPGDRNDHGRHARKQRRRAPR